MGCIPSTNSTSNTHQYSSITNSNYPQQDNTSNHIQQPEFKNDPTQNPSLNHNIQQPDLSLFKEIEEPSKHCNDHQKCPSLNRLALTLKYYSKLDIINNQQHQNIFIHFVKEVHKSLLNDYIHFVKCHGHQIEDIQKDFIENRRFISCDMKTCTFTSRHHGIINTNTSQNINAKSDPSHQIYKQTLDSLHFYLFHIFHCGLRTLSTTKSQTVEFEEKESKDNEYFDKEFARIKSQSFKTNVNTESFVRFGRTNNSKFTLNTQNYAIDYDDDYIDNDQEDVETFIDSLYAHLQRMKIDDRMIINLQKFLESEQYETDALSLDIIDIGHNGNILEWIKDPQTKEYIINFMNTANSMCIFIIS